jgi:hypothetical protein
MGNRLFKEAMVSIIITLLVIGIMVSVINEAKVELRGYVDSQVGEIVEERVEQKLKEEGGDRVLYRVTYNDGEEFYFQTEKRNNPFEIAERYLPEEYKNLKIMKSNLLEEEQK